MSLVKNEHFNRFRESFLYICIPMQEKGVAPASTSDLEDIVGDQCCPMQRFKTREKPSVA